jgi:hypothetical protein
VGKILCCYVDDDTLATLERTAEQTGRKVEELAEAAIVEECLRADRDQPREGSGNAGLI